MLDYLLFALAWLGHACLLMVLVNLVYAHPWHRTLLKFFRAMIGILIFAGPPAFAWLIGFRVVEIIESSTDSLERAVEAIFCLRAIHLVRGVAGRHRAPLRAAPSPNRTRRIDPNDRCGEGVARSALWGRRDGCRCPLPFNNIFNVDFTTLTLGLPGLPPALDGLTLLQIGDLHFLGTPSQRFFDFIVQHCMRAGTPDFVLITGDVVDTETHHEWIAPILGQLRWNIGAYAVLGNHDWWQDYELVRESLRKIGVHMVGNRWEQVDARGEKLTIIGHEGPWFRPGPDLSTCPTDGLRILLSHTPDNIRWAQRNNVELMLSGHNHGGQIRLPLFGSIFVPSKFSRRYDMGTFFESPTLLHVNRGLSGKAPLRFRCNPQVTRIVLRCDLEGKRF